MQQPIIGSHRHIRLIRTSDTEGVPRRGAKDLGIIQIRIKRVHLLEPRRANPLQAIPPARGTFEGGTCVGYASHSRQLSNNTIAHDSLIDSPKRDKRLSKNPTRGQSNYAISPALGLLLHSVIALKVKPHTQSKLETALTIVQNRVPLRPRNRTYMGTGETLAKV